MRVRLPPPAPRSNCHRQRHPTRVLSRNPTAAAQRLPAGVEVTFADLTKPDTLATGLRDAAHVVLTAGVYSGWPASNAHVKAVEYDGVVNALRAAANGGDLRGRFLYMTASGLPGGGRHSTSGRETRSSGDCGSRSRFGAVVSTMPSSGWEFCWTDHAAGDRSTLRSRNCLCRSAIEFPVRTLPRCSLHHWSIPPSRERHSRLSVGPGARAVICILC
jgi:hypothetical protein